MISLSKLRSFSFAALKQKMFRRDVENAILDGKQFTLPELPPQINAQSLFNKFTQENASLRDKLQEFVRYSSPETGTKILQRGDDVLARSFSIYRTKFQTKSEINWQYDYLNNYEFPMASYWKYNRMEFPFGTELTVPLVMGRFYHVHDLAVAYSLSGEEKYVTGIIEIIQSFIDNNPLYQGVQWHSPAEVAIRLINFLQAGKLVLHSPQITPERLDAYFHFVLAHIMYLENNLDLKPDRDHRYLVGVLALQMAGLLFGDTDYGRKLLSVAQFQIEQELRRQFHTDGTSYLQSISAHAFSCEVLFHALYNVEKYSLRYSRDFSSIIKKTARTLCTYLREDGTIPHLGDFCNCVVLPFGRDNTQLNIAHVLTLHAILFNDAELAGTFFKPDFDHYLYFDKERVEQTKYSATQFYGLSSAGLRDGGHYWLRDYTGVDMFVKASGLGRNGRGAPGHDDPFTFELHYKNNPFIVDSGMFSVFANPDLRNAQRSVMGHNTPYIDDMPLIGKSATTETKTDISGPKVLMWRTTPGEDILVAQHYAYVRLYDPSIIKRTFHFNKDNKEIRIKDEFLGGAGHKIALNLFLHPEAKVVQESKEVFIIASGNAAARIRFFVNDDAFETAILESSYSDRYYHVEKSSKIYFAYQAEFPATYTIEITLL
jgi:hypothetical protein